MKNSKGAPLFKTVVSIEKDEFAHQTLLLRHFFRNFEDGKVPEEYYDFIMGSGSLKTLEDRYPSQWVQASKSALKLSLGTEPQENVRNLIKKSLGNLKKWVLVGGPPCQAYSLVGRSRRMNDETFAEDEKHFLYQEYLKIIIDHAPPVFVMENVKGLLSAKLNGVSTMQKIIQDLSHPKRAISGKGNGLHYKLFSLSKSGEFTEEVDSTAFIVKSEEYGVPQARHRIFIVGIRSDFNIQPQILKKHAAPTVREIIGNMPRIRSGLSKGQDSSERWKSLIASSANTKWLKTLIRHKPELAEALLKITKTPQKLPSQKKSHRYVAPSQMRGWFYDPRLKSISLHESRSHMDTDIHRYLFAAAYAQVTSISPKIADFPEELLPQHKNVHDARAGKMFSDRFRVQLDNRYSTTITSHISKDGHYFIHYDPTQCRSLTVREAARLQTFPDNYFFAGPRTEQYHQVGNAVPPYLAHQIAEIISDILDQIPEGED